MKILAISSKVPTFHQYVLSKQTSKCKNLFNVLAHPASSTGTHFFFSGCQLNPDLGAQLAVIFVAWSAGVSWHFSILEAAWTQSKHHEKIGNGENKVIYQVEVAIDSIRKKWKTIWRIMIVYNIYSSSNVISLFKNFGDTIVYACAF